VGTSNCGGVRGGRAPYKNISYEKSYERKEAGISERMLSRLGENLQTNKTVGNLVFLRESWIVQCD
jgi:hypothetical protein